MPRTFKVEVTGEAVSFIAVLEVPVMFDAPKTEQRTVRLSMQNMSCFLKTVKPGEAVVKIMPIGLDGKEQQPQEITLKVGSNPKQKQKKEQPGKLPS